MARVVEDEVERIVKGGQRPAKHWGSREYTYKKELLKKRKLARQRKRKARNR